MDLKSDNDSEHTSMISVGPFLHHSQFPVTSYYIRSLPIDLLHSYSFLSPSLFFFLCNLFLSFSFYSQFMFAHLFIIIIY